MTGSRRPGAPERTLRGVSETTRRTKAKPVDDRPRARGKLVKAGVLEVVLPVWRFVVLLDDGSTIAMLTTQDGSVAREVVLAHVGKDRRVAGVSDGEHVGWSSISVEDEP
jgi:hypothetical protein